MKVQDSVTMLALFGHIPAILDRYRKLEDCLENPTYHPEGNTKAHINLVIKKAIKQGDLVPKTLHAIRLICAACLHDICKLDSGAWTTSKNDNVYWSNPDHPKQAYELIVTDDALKHAIVSLCGEYKTVAEICRLHMEAKLLDRTNGKAVARFQRKCENTAVLDLYQYLNAFVRLDDMIDRYS